MNSVLSEYAVLGYELGYSMETPHQLVINTVKIPLFCLFYYYMAPEAPEIQVKCTKNTLKMTSQQVIWEAQFGDFINGAQIMIDQ